MKKAIWIATILLVAGLLISMAALALVGFDIYKLDTSTYQEETFELTGEITDIQISAQISNIRFAPSEDGICKVVSRHKEYMDLSVFVKDGTLVIKETDTRKWYEYIAFSFGNGEITVYLPEFSYQNLNIRTDTGDISVPKDFIFISANLSTDTGDIKYAGSLLGDLKAVVDTGDITLENINTFGNITLESDTGDIYMKNVICQTLKAETDTGDVTLVKNDADSINIETDTGDITGSLLSSKIFIVDNSTGKVVVPQTFTGGRCELETDTGDIKITIE